MQDDKRGMHYAHIFAQKEFENTFLLSGGIEKFVEDFPELLEGKNVPKVHASAPLLKKVNSGATSSQSSSKISKSPKAGLKSYNI